MLPAIAKEPRERERSDLHNNRPWFMAAPSISVGSRENPLELDFSIAETAVPASIMITPKHSTDR